MRITALLVVVVVGLLVGCQSNDHAWMPLKLKSSWQYNLASGLQADVVTFTVEKESPVDGSAGAQLSGPGGSSRMGWVGTSLNVAEFAGTSYSPSLPILRTAPKYPIEYRWSGLLTTGHRSFAASATIQVDEDKYTLGGKPINALRSTVTMLMNKQEFVITTWFGQGIGILRQEERTKNMLSRSIDYLSGP